MARHQQQLFNPADYCFAWAFGWYEWNSQAAHLAARQDRDNLGKKLKQKGYNVTRFTIRHQLITRGGIGSGHPEVSLVVTVYGVNYWRDQPVTWTPVVYARGLEKSN